MEKFTESGLNGQKVNGQAVAGVTSKTCYSKVELEEFKQIIILKLERAKEDLSLLETLHFNENGTDDTYHQIKVLEMGQETVSRTENSKAIERQRKHIGDLRNALLRIENRTYGICRKTGKLISKERLRAVPHATLSIMAKKNDRGEVAPVNGRQLAIGKRHQ